MNKTIIIITILCCLALLSCSSTHIVTDCIPSPTEMATAGGDTVYVWSNAPDGHQIISIYDNSTSGATLAAGPIAITCMAAAPTTLFWADSVGLTALDLASSHRSTIPYPDDVTSASDLVVVGDLLLASSVIEGTVYAIDLDNNGAFKDNRMQPLIDLHGANLLCYTGNRLFITTPDSTTTSTSILVIDDFATMTPHHFAAIDSHISAMAAHDDRLFIATASGIQSIDTSDSSLIEPLDITLTTPLSTVADMTIASDRLYITDTNNDRIVSVKIK